MNRHAKENKVPNYLLSLSNSCSVRDCLAFSLSNLLDLVIAPAFEYKTIKVVLINDVVLGSVDYFTKILIFGYIIYSILSEGLYLKKTEPLASKFPP